VVLTSQVNEFRSARFDVEHRLMLGDMLAVEGRETRVWATSDPADASRIKPLAVPEHIVARFQA
jgi:4-hydroxybenzoyl-CoA thioesterase